MQPHMDPRVARNLLALLQPQLDQARALVEAASALSAIAGDGTEHPLPAPPSPPSRPKLAKKSSRMKGL